MVTKYRSNHFNCFSEQLLLEEYRHPDIKSATPLELDFFFPKYNLAFEFQVFYCENFLISI